MVRTSYTAHTKLDDDGRWFTDFSPVADVVLDLLHEMSHKFLIPFD